MIDITTSGMKLTFGRDAPILRPILHQIAEKWRILGFLLGFDHNTLDNLAKFAGSNESYLDKVISKWLCGDSTHPQTLESLVGAIRNQEIGEEEIATKLLKGNIIVGYLTSLTM